MKKHTVIIVLVVCAIICLLLPLAIDWLIIGNNLPSNISNSDWVGFLGGYVGAIVGCIISLVGIIWTIKFTREQNRADRELQVRPCFDIRYVPATNTLPNGVFWLGYVLINEFEESAGDSKDTERGLLQIKNVGNGPATNIDVAVIVDNIKVKYKARFNNKNLNVTSNSIPQSEEAAISIWITNNSVAPAKNDLKWNENGFADYDSVRFKIPSNYDITIFLSYNDLLGNLFSQELKFNVVYGMKYDKENGGQYHCDINLVEKGVPQKKLRGDKTP